MKEYGNYIQGNAGRDAEMRVTQGGKEIWNVTVATYAGKDQTTWIKCFSFEDCLKNVRKGDKLRLWGALSLNQYEHKGEQKASIELKCWECEQIPKNQDVSRDNYEITSEDIPGGSTEEIPF